MAEKVEGWSNYPTWAVNLWLANDRKLNERARVLVASVETTAPRLEWDLAHRGDVAAVLKAWVTDQAPNLGGVFGDLLSYALGDVDWYELAEEWIGNAAAEVTA